MVYLLSMMIQRLPSYHNKIRLVLQIVQDTFENIEEFILTIKLAESSLEAFRINKHAIV